VPHYVAVAAALLVCVDTSRSQGPRVPEHAILLHPFAGASGCLARVPADRAPGVTRVVVDFSAQSGSPSEGTDTPLKLTPGVECAAIEHAATHGPQGLDGGDRFLDLLWWQWSSAAPGAILAERPELAELDRAGRRGDEVGLGCYASPWHPDVRKALAALGSSVAASLTEGAKLYVRCRLSPEEMLGYSEAARATYIREAGIDPLDLPRLPSEGRAKTDLESWLRWRFGGLTVLMGDVAARFRQPPLRRGLVAVVLAGAYRGSQVGRGRAAEDWLTWILDDIIDGVLLEGAWEEGSEDRDYASALGIIAKTGKEIEIGVMLRAPSKQGDTALQRQQEIVLAQGRAPDYWMIEVNDEAGLQAAKEFLAAQPRGPAPDAP